MGNVVSEFGRLITGVGRDIQCKVMPVYTSVDLGTIVQYTGVTDSNYINGYFYKCTNSGWELTDVQDVSDKAKKVSSPTTDDLAKLTATGDLADSGKKLSDLVLKSDVKDVLNSTSTTDPLSANMGRVLNEKVESLTNPNLLDNPWFTVNQRGFSNGTFSQLTYFVDRWQGNKVISLSANGVTMTPSGGDAAIRQTYPSEDTANMLNKTYTASAMLSDGAILSGTADIGNLASLITLFNDAENSGVRCAILKVSSNQIVLQYATTKTVTIKAVKLEIGTISTLANDVAPNYAFELAKCRASTADPSDTYANKGDLVNYEDLTSLYLTGSTNSTGSTINAGTFFYLNGSYCKAKTNIANGATFTLNTNFEVVSVGGEISSINDNLSKNTFGTIVDLTAYTYASPYICPSDGYVTVAIYQNNPNSTAEAQIRDASTANTPMLSILSSSSGLYEYKITFVKKGFRLYGSISGAGVGSVSFVPFV